MPYRGKKRKKSRTHQVVDVAKEKVPQSIVAKKGSVGLSISDLVKNFRGIMAPNTSAHLVEKKTNSVKDYINIAGPYGVTHIVLFSKTSTYPRMRIGCFPQGPTVHFRIKEYTLMRDLMKDVKTSIDVTTPFYKPPVLVLNNFPAEDKPLQLVMKTFQNMFPAIDPEKIKVNECKRVLLLQYDVLSNTIILRHYSITKTIAGVGKAVRSIINQKSIPNLGGLKDISDYILGGDGDGDEFDLDEGDSTVSGGSLSSLASTSTGTLKQSIRLAELGPRMRLELMAVENGLFQGEFLFNSQSKEEQQDVLRQRKVEKNLQVAEVEETKKSDVEREKQRKLDIDQKREDDRLRESRKSKKIQARKTEKKETMAKKGKGKVIAKKGK